MAPKPVFAALSPDARMTAKQVQVTREELHEEVWSQPTSLIAQKYEISDVVSNTRPRSIRAASDGS